MWWFECAWPREWHYYEVWPYWRKYANIGVGFETLLLTAWKTVCSWLPLDKDVELSPSRAMPALKLSCSLLDNGLNL